MLDEEFKEGGLETSILPVQDQDELQLVRNPSMVVF
jgi:hypothetical protein